MSDSILRGGRIIGPDGRAIHQDIMIRDGAIAAIDRPGSFTSETPQRIDATGMLLHPGLMNGHTHSQGALARGLGDRWTLELILVAGPWAYGGRTLAEKRLSATINAAEMALKGCTAAYDLFYEFPVPSEEGMAAVAEAYADVGIRLTLAPMVADRTFYEAIPGLLEAIPDEMRRGLDIAALAPAADTMQAMASAFACWPFPQDRVQFALAPTIPLHCSDDFMVACARLAADYGVGCQTHLAETKVQAVSGLKTYGKSLTHHLDDLGLLSDRFSGAHAIWLDDDDMDRLARAGASIVNNAASNMHCGAGLADIRAMADRGVNLAIGTDGSICSDNQNMYEAMHIASLASKVRGPHTDDWITAAEVLTAATEGSAKAMGLNARLGKLAPGYRADVVFLDTRNINMIPLNNPVNQIVHAEDGTSVHSVMVDGEFIVRDRRLTRIDISKLAEEAEAAVDRLSAANAEVRRFCEKMAGVVNRFCPALSAESYPVDRYGTCQSCGGRHDAVIA